MIEVDSLGPDAARDRGATRYYWHTQADNATARALYDQVARFTGFIRYQYPLLPRSAMALTPAMNRSTPSR